MKGDLFICKIGLSMKCSKEVNQYFNDFCLAYLNIPKKKNKKHLFLYDSNIVSNFIVHCTASSAFSNLFP